MAYDRISERRAPVCCFEDIIGRNPHVHSFGGRTEWALKIDVSTPAASRVAFSHLATVLDVTAFSGLIIAMNSLVSSPLMFFVRCSYALSVFTGHKSGRFGHDGKKKLCMVFPCLDCLASPVGVNSTPSALKDLVLRSSIDRSPGRVRASSMAAFQVKSFCDRSLLHPKAFK